MKTETGMENFSTLSRKYVFMSLFNSIEVKKRSSFIDSVLNFNVSLEGKATILFITENNKVSSANNLYKQNVDPVEGY